MKVYGARHHDGSNLKRMLTRVAQDGQRHAGYTLFLNRTPLFLTFRTYKSFREETTESDYNKDNPKKGSCRHNFNIRHEKSSRHASNSAFFL